MAAELPAPPCARRNAPRKKSSPSNWRRWAWHEALLDALARHEFNTTAVAVGLALSIHADNRTGESWPSIATLAQRVGAPVYNGRDCRSIRYSLAALERAGLIEIRRRGHMRPNLYLLLCPPAAQGEGEWQNPAAMSGKILPPILPTELESTSSTVVSPSSARADADDPKIDGNRVFRSIPTRPPEPREGPKGQSEGFQELRPSSASEGTDLAEGSAASARCANADPLDQVCTPPLAIGKAISLAKLEAECRALVGSSPAAICIDFSPIARLVAEGASEADVLGGIRAAMSLPGFRPRSWTVFTRFIRRERVLRAAAASGACPSTEKIVSHRMRALKQIHDEALAEEAARQNWRRICLTTYTGSLRGA